MQASKQFDVIIIGGSYAGLSAALALGRSMRKVLILDNGKPCNKQTPHSHNFLTQDGNTPSAIAQQAKEQVLKYENVAFQNDTVLNIQKDESKFLITTAKSENLLARKIIFATGITDIYPNIKEFDVCWGISVIHCPYCHGYEFRKLRTAILANGERAFHLASLIKNLTDEIAIITNDISTFQSVQLEKLKQHNIVVINKNISALNHNNGQLNTIVFEDGSEANFNVLYAAIPFKQQTELPEKLGCTLTDLGHISVDDFQNTSVYGIYACGDNASMMRSLANAVASGNLAGSMCNKALIDEDF